MNYKVVISLILLISFILTFISGFVRSLHMIHDPIAILTLILVIVHIIMYWKIIVVGLKCN
jgi:hypothetical protein